MFLRFMRTSKGINSDGNKLIKPHQTFYFYMLVINWEITQQTLDI